MPKSAVNISLPKSWPAKVCAAMLHVVSLAKYAAVYTRSWAADSRHARVRLRADKDRLLHEAALLREEIRIKDARMASLPPHSRPFYPPSARLAILEVRAARSWSLEQTAAAFRLSQDHCQLDETARRERIGCAGATTHASQQVS